MVFEFPVRWFLNSRFVRSSIDQVKERAIRSLRSQAIRRSMPQVSRIGLGSRSREAAPNFVHPPPLERPNPEYPKPSPVPPPSSRSPEPSPAVILQLSEPSPAVRPGVSRRLPGPVSIPQPLPLFFDAARPPLRAVAVC
jgi:hypothetical protein